MGGQLGRDLSQVGMGFMSEMGKIKMAERAQQKAQQTQFTTNALQQLASMGQLNDLDPQVLKSMQGVLGKDVVGMAMEQSNLNRAIGQARQGASNFITQRTEQVPAYGPAGAMPEGIQGPPTAQQVEEIPKTTITREATPAQAYERFRQLDPTGVYLLTGNVQAGQLAQQGMNLKQAQRELLLNQQKLAWDKAKPQMTKRYEVQREDGTVSNVIGLINPDGSVQQIDIGQAPNKDKLGRLTDSYASLTSKLDNPNLTGKQRKALETRKKIAERGLQKELAQGTGINMVMGDDGEMLGIASTPQAARELLMINRMTKGLDTQEIRNDRKIVRTGALALKTLDRIQGLASRTTVGPGGKLFNTAQNVMANLRAMPEVLGAVTESINGTKGDIKKEGTNQERAFWDKKFKSAPSKIHQYAYSLIYRLAKLDDPNSVVREGEFDRYEKQLFGGTGILGSGEAFMSSLEAQRELINDRIAASRTNVERVEAERQRIIQQIRGGQVQAEPGLFSDEEEARALQAQQQTGPQVEAQQDQTFSPGKGRVTAAQLQPQWGLGALTVSEESSGDPGVVGNEPDGTKSYGAYQINDRNMPEFLQFAAQAVPQAAQALSQAQPGTPQFSQQWQQVAQQYPQEFAQIQTAFAQEKFFKPAMQSFAQQTGIQNVPEAIQQAIFSTGVNHGGYDKIFGNMKKFMPGQPQPLDIAKALYASRWQYVSGLKNLDAKTKDALANRYNRELNQVAGML